MKKKYVVIAKFGEDGSDAVQITKKGGELFTYEEATEVVKEHLEFQEDFEELYFVIKEV